jgi:hypothetical protein
MKLPLTVVLVLTMVMGIGGFLYTGLYDPRYMKQAYKERVQYPGPLAEAKLEETKAKYHRECRRIGYVSITTILASGFALYRLHRHQQKQLA